ncbi:hypothetical protein JCGZ_14036 [Jatropha curcas]|uniref:Transmembrane protein n=1 Tax=Jatropha curcas TaxID=180498 RepID=A0A067K7N6_JATCU|nr:uncharacterized protein LOC105643310 [Jatropha curcas]KDP28265.1 hypothetical protein JCGZ_14036 [Jatropha curcas]
MGWQNWQNKAKELFAICTITLLSILLPLSFLLLARLSCYSYLLSLVGSEPTQPPLNNFFIFSLFLYGNPAILYFLVSIFSIVTLLHALTGKITILTESSGEFHRPRLYTAWILLCTLQVCVGLGIEGTITAGIDGYSFDTGIHTLLSRVIFFLGLHETMLYWCRMVVKPVVDDTIFGVAKEEKWVQRVAVAMSFGGLWWWRLRDEVESLVIVAESKREISVGIAVGDFLGWWLYYVTVTIGMIRIVKGLMWIFMILLCTRARRNSNEPCEIVDKV